MKFATTVFLLNLCNVLIVDGTPTMNKAIQEVGAPVLSELESETVDLLIRRSRSLESKHDLYEVSYRAFDQDRIVRLRRNEKVTSEEDSLYSTNFRVITLDMDPNGSSLFEDKTPPKEEILASENKIYYFDLESDSVVQINENEKGKLTVRGIIDGRSISPTAETGKGNVTHTISKEKVPTKDDFEDIYRPTKPYKSRAEFTGIPKISAEVFIVFDLDNTKLHNGNSREIMDYLTVLFKSINNRFATLKETIQIQFKISGLVTVQSPNAQPFIENHSVLNGKGYDIVKVLDHFSKWLYLHQRKVPAHDLAALITGRNMYTVDAKGNYSGSVTGYSYIKGACWVSEKDKKYMGTSVTEDVGGYWFGVFSIAHEFAHNLGAPHDGEEGGGKYNKPSTLDCPKSQGYLMSYEGWGKKSKFYFSPCSARLMKEFLVSNGAICMKFQNARTNWKDSTRDVGDNLSMKAMCVKYTKRNDAYVDPSKTPSELCKNLACRYPGKAGRGSYDWIILNHSPGDNVPCAKGKRCVNGDCS